MIGRSFPVTNKLSSFSSAFLQILISKEDTLKLRQFSVCEMQKWINWIESLVLCLTCLETKFHRLSEYN